jgi:hypothetical protein
VKLVVSVATPALVSVAVPRLWPLLVNVTLPVGVPLAPLTVAVRVTGWPTRLGLGLLARVSVGVEVGVEV